ncbi:MAG TPA: hypothetical protein VJ698_23140 [Noviherbaspirillum sp.]|uniref:hypothetical protein n=1 Tax=Noviherbaspirillum sp. TaxID=1926288 RepID=UPI002B48BBF7|nr:hypothetical protein [Noviherbaspirillum sp.]HJV88383.1 hypothetical protein [Noviherbaspirillum sp.]
MRGKRIFEQEGNSVGMIIEQIDLDPADREELELLAGMPLPIEFVSMIEGGLSNFRNLFTEQLSLPKAGDIRKTLSALARIKNDQELIAAFQNSGSAIAEIERQVMIKRYRDGEPLQGLSPKSAAEIRELALLAIQWLDAQSYGENIGGRPSKESLRLLVIPWAMRLWILLGKKKCAISIHSVLKTPSPCLRWICLLIGLAEDVNNTYPTATPDPRDIARLIKKVGTVSPM